MKLTQETILKAIEWGREKPTRTIDIDINTKFKEEQIWCYDHNIMIGKFVYNIDDIPYDGELEKLKKEELKREYNRYFDEV